MLKYILLFASVFSGSFALKAGKNYLKIEISDNAQDSFVLIGRSKIY